MYGSTRSTDISDLLLWKMSSFSYKTRGFRNKGAVLTMVWNFAAFLLISYCIHTSSINMGICFAVSTLLYPFAGWLADVCFGRYGTIRCSMWIIVTAVIVLNIWLVVEKYILQTHYFPEVEHEKKKTIHAVRIVVGGVLFIGLAGFQANAIQFGIDQFIDASSSDISSYISWYAWSYYLSVCLVVLSQICFCGIFNESTSFLLISLFCTLSLVSDVLLNDWLIKEPVSHNPLKMIFQVLRYAMKNRYPRLRSAFTYWDDKPFYRIDLAKTKYGGPFTTEQVEDVKTFFRILVIVGVSSLFMGLVFVLDSTFAHLMFHYRDDHFVKSCSTASPTEYLSNCFERQVVRYLSSFVIVFLVPFFEFLLYPLLRKCTPCANVGIMHKFILGMFLQLLYELYILSVEVVATRMPQNHNVTCLLDAQEKDLLDHHVLSMDFKWLIPLRLCSGISSYLLLTSATEFVCAQAPYSMKGLLAGVVYGISGISLVLAFSGMLGIHKLTWKSNMSFISRTCGVWYYLSVLIYSFILVCIGIIVKKWYSPRRRDENVHNEQIFAVNYFDQYNSGTR